MSSGGLDRIGRLGIQVLPDGVVMDSRSHGNKHVPNGVSEGNDAVTFKEDYSETVAGSTDQQLAQPGLLWLQKRHESCYDETVHVVQNDVIITPHHGEDDKSWKNSHHRVADQLHELISEAEKSFFLAQVCSSMIKE